MKLLCINICLTGSLTNPCNCSLVTEGLLFDKPPVLTLNSMWCPGSYRGNLDKPIIGKSHNGSSYKKSHYMNLICLIIMKFCTHTDSHAVSLYTKMFMVILLVYLYEIKSETALKKKIHSFMAQVQGSVVCYLEEVSHPKYIPSWHITVQVWTYDSAKRFITNIAWFNLKISYYWDQKSNCGDKMIIRSSYPHSRNSYTWKTAPSYWSNPLIPDSALLSASAEIKFKILLQSLPA